MAKLNCKFELGFLIIFFLLLCSSILPFLLPEVINISLKEEYDEKLKNSWIEWIWTTTEVISTESMDSSLNGQVAIDGTGNIHVVWQDRTNYNGSGTDNDIFYKRWNATSNTWTATEVVSTESGGSSEDPSISIDGTGNIHVVWDDRTYHYNGSGTDWDIFYKQWNATSSTWTITEVVSTESTDESWYPHSAIDATGNLHVVWQDLTNYSGSGTDWDIFYKQWNATSSTWTITEVISTESTDESEYPTISIDDIGNIHVVWEDDTNYNGSGSDSDIFYKQWNATSSTWTITEVVSTESTDGSWYPHSAIDDIGNIHVVWDDNTNYNGSGADSDIFYKRWDTTSSTWTTTEVVSTESTVASWYAHIAIDATGNLHVVWDDRTNYSGSGTDLDIFYKRWDTTSSTWTTTEVVSTESTDESDYPTISIDGTGNIHVVWDDRTNYNGSGTDYDIFYKQLRILSSEIIINSPDQNAFFGNLAPNFDVSVMGSNINTTWYTLDEGATNITFSGLTGTIDQTEWDKLSNGQVTIRFYANDSLGQNEFKEVLIWKDTISPQIMISSPTPNELCGITTPSFNIQIIEPNLQQKYYSLNGRPNITFTTETEFSQTEWDQIGNGTVLITFYAIDKVGNTNSSEYFVRKDAYTPVITVYSPLDEESFGSTAPNFSISIIEEDLDSTWYTIEGVDGIFSITGLTGTIDQTEWDNTLEGQITITFYAQDRAGNTGIESVTVIKSIPSQPSVPGYNLFYLFGILSVVVIILSKKLKKF